MDFHKNKIINQKLEILYYVSKIKNNVLQHLVLTISTIVFRFKITINDQSLGYSCLDIFFQDN